MKLVDTSVWIDFWRGAPAAAVLGGLLETNEVLLHPSVIGELALGHLGPRRTQIIAELRMLPAAPLARDEEVLAMIDRWSLGGRGLGWVDAHLLASAKLASAELWTNDQRLARAWRDAR